MVAHEQMQSRGNEIEKETDERLKSLTMRIHQTEELVTNMKQANSATVPTGDPANESAPDVSHQVKVQMLEHRLNGLQQKVDGLNPVFLLTMETRLEDLHGDLIELRNLYSSPTSSLNLVLDGLLKKVKDLEAGDRSSPGRKMPPTTLGNVSQAGASTRTGNEGISYR